jgi:UDP-glucose 4-epimerase
MATNIVTGAAGFVGSHLVEALLERKERVIGIDHFNDYYDPSFKRYNIKPFATHPDFQLIEADIQDLDWRSLLDDVAVVYHQAAQAGVRASWGTGFRGYTERNLNATQVMLEAAKNATHLQRFVFASSSSVYGNAQKMPTGEDTCPQPVSPYGITKLASEQLCLLYYRNFGVPVSGLRYFTVYGPRQRPDMAFHKFLHAALKDEEIVIFGDGQQTRDFTYISDAIAANLGAATAPDAPGEVFNIGGGSRVSLAYVIDTMETVVGRPIRRQYLESAVGDARHTSADVSKAQRIMGYNPQVSLEEGLTLEWAWIQDVYG